MQQLLLRRPYQIAWLAIPVILLPTCFGAASTLDIQLHSTYFAVAPFHVGLLIGLFCAIVGGLYELVRHERLIN